jgi:carboxymethylenebutenolidase
MCFDNDSVPLISTVPQTAVAATSITITSADGSVFSAFLAIPKRPSGAAIVVLPDMRGLYRFYENLAVRLAEQGHTALAIDYFGRTAGTGSRDDNFPFMEHIFRVTRATLDDDLQAAANYLRSEPGGSNHSVLALGFCFGGRQAFLASAPRFRLTGVIGFYGAPGFYPNGAPGPTQRAAELSAPILAIFGGDDEGIPANQVQAFDQALIGARVPHEIVVYPGAPHSFFDIKHEEHAQACADGWQRVLAFIADHSNREESKIRC